MNRYWNKIGGTAWLPGIKRSADRFCTHVFRVIRKISTPFATITQDEPNISLTRWKIKGPTTAVPRAKDEETFAAKLVSESARCHQQASETEHGGIGHSGQHDRAAAKVTDNRRDGKSAA